MSNTGINPGLLKANAHRKQKADIKRALKAGRLTLGDLLEAPPECCSRVMAFDALQWVPGVGLKTAHKIARGVLTETLPLCHVGPTTRRQLVERVKTQTGVAR